ncbi:DUF6248 family natural product biosynthesis protein [Streptomyces sp. RLB3-6]|uniref:DUF6248 family natural product biosynthesis protein n=1 Tax=Streptomyces sp. RLB3-6 TaxID=2594457 RepID=UPI0011634233|nr:DUF6248 family natural product biosynthesis protein [Streptomyces sp. RLB3-6]QDN84382.1 hypothetical protein FNV61_00195 [Streptomyces sp. RLB3-6]
MTEIEAGEPTPQTCLRVAREAAELAVAAADNAMNAVCRSSSGNAARLEEVMHAAHREATEAEGHAARAEQWAADPSMPDSALNHCARGAVDHAVRAQGAAGVEVTAAALRTALERRLTPEEHAERESERRRAEAEQEAAERAATGMDSDNRHLAAMNGFLAKEAVPALGWTAGHVRVLEAAETGRLYWRDGQARQAAEHGVWSGGRKVSRERTQDLHAAGFLTAVDAADGARVLAPTPMGQVALELARLHPAGLHESDKAAYEARYARVAKHGGRQAQRDAARRLPPLDGTALRLYLRPVTLAEQEARAQRDAADQWEAEGGYCPGVETPCPADEDQTASVPAEATGDVTEPDADELPWPPGVLPVRLVSTRYSDWWGLECGRCEPGVRAPLPGKWDDRGDARIAAQGHYDQAHRPADDALTAQEWEELERWPLSAAQYTALSWAGDGQLYEDRGGFVGVDVRPDKFDVNKKVARGRATGLWAAGLLNVGPDCPGVRQLHLSETGRRVLNLVWRAHRQGVADAPKDANLTPLPKRSAGYPLLSEGRYFKGEQRPAADPAPAEPVPVPAAAEPTPPTVATVAPVRADQPLLRRLFAPRAAREQRPACDVRTVIRRPQRTLTPEEHKRVLDTRALNLQGALIMGIVDPVPNASPMPEEAGEWVREQVWPDYFREIDEKYPHGFTRWSMCERGTCWNCLSGRHDICVHRQRGGPNVDEKNQDWVHNQEGRRVAPIILRPGGEPCVWWCRCSCPKDGPAPARPVKSKAAPAETPAKGAPAPEPAEVQAALW